MRSCPLSSIECGNYRKYVEGNHIVIQSSGEASDNNNIKYEIHGIIGTRTSRSNSSSSSSRSSNSSSSSSSSGSGSGSGSGSSSTSSIFAAASLALQALKQPINKPTLNTYAEGPKLKAYSPQASAMSPWWRCPAPICGAVGCFDKLTLVRSYRFRSRLFSGLA